MDKFRNSRLFRFLGALEFRLLELSLAALVLMNGVGVFTRYVMNNALGELFEIMILLSVATYWLGVATAERLGGHLGMDLLMATLSGKPRAILEFVRRAVIVGFLAVVVYSGTRLTMTQYRFATNSGILDMPLWIFSVFIPIGGLLLAWRVVFAPRREPHLGGTV
jgi:TRAP-type C4-dicarboxylate transport system permease small subunit